MMCVQYCVRISLTQLHQPSTQVKVVLVKLKAIKNEAVTKHISDGMHALLDARMPTERLHCIKVGRK